MQKGKTVSAYLEPGKIARLDQLRGNIPRSQALSKILNYILSQPDAWVADFIKADQA